MGYRVHCGCWQRVHRERLSELKNNGHPRPRCAGTGCGVLGGITREGVCARVVWFAMYSRYAGDWDNFAKSSGLLTRPWASTGIVTSSSLSTRSPGMSPEGSCFSLGEVRGVGSMASGFAAERCVPVAVVHVATVMGEAGNHTKDSTGMDPHEAAVTLPAARASARAAFTVRCPTTPSAETA